jgi:hypothetical protein
MDESDIRLTVGWRYLVHSQGSGEQSLRTVGTFLGYTALGQDTALVVEAEPEEQGATVRQRIIPAASILYLELLERRGLREQEGQDAVYFG